MAKYVSNASINLQVNGSQARKMLDQLKKDAAEYTKKMNEAAGAGNTAEAQKYQKKLKETNKLLNQLKTETKSVTDVLLRLDKASPKELNKTLSTLRRQLNNMERGSDAWKEKTEQIRRVKNEIKAVNQSISATQTGFEKFKSLLGTYATGISVTLAQFGRLVDKAREYVETFTGMQSEEANVRKFTGMSEDDVKVLNKSFLGIDTRTSREDLNRLAQEAGRLGKTSVEDVLGFVKAADQINVSLDDLGDDATLTLSKLTGIFGVEKELGTEKSLLAVGSVINELSQNCTASAPYLTEFAKRMAGVGAQADMSIPQIMAYAAVLDSQGQNVEASSTALSQLIMKLYKEPAKIARTAGLDVKTFTDTLKKDANEALLMLLERLNAFGGVNNLAKIFADMGTDGARATATIAALAGNVDTLRWQQENANKAFSEATSITKEFSVQNNTAAANLDKEKKKLHEVSVALGERLYPFVCLATSATTSLMKIISTVIGFLLEYKTVILGAAAGLGVYKTVIALVAMEQKILNAETIIHAKWLKLKRVLTLAYLSTVGSLTKGLSKAAAAQRMLQSSMSASAWGAILAVIGAVIGAILQYANKCNEAAKRERELAEQRKKFREEAVNISNESVENYAKEVTGLKLLYKAATDEAKSKEERIKAAQKLQSIYPDQFAKMNTEAIMLGDAKKAYDDLTQAIINNAKAKAAADKVLENEKKILELEESLDQNREKYTKADTELKQISAYNKAQSDAVTKQATSVAGAIAMGAGGYNENAHQKKSDSVQQKELREAAAEIRKSKGEIATLRKANEKLTNRFGKSEAFQAQLETGVSMNPSENLNADTDNTPEYTSSKEAEKERKKREKEARAAAIKERKEFKEDLKAVEAEREAALAELKALRAIGQVDYRDFISKEYEIKKKYFENAGIVYKKYDVADEDDADYQKLLNKKQDLDQKYNAERIALNKEAIERIAAIEEKQIQARYNAKKKKSLADELQLQEELMTVRYNKLMDVQSLYEETSKEWYEYEKKIQDLLYQDQETKRKAVASSIAEFEKKYQKQSAAESLALQLATLKELYKQKYITEEQYQKWKAGLEKEAGKNIPGGKRISKAKQSANNATAKFNQQKEELDKAKESGLIDEEEYSRRLESITLERSKSLTKIISDCSDPWVSALGNMAEAWEDFAQALNDSDDFPFDELGKGIEATAAIMTAVMQQVTAYTEAQSKIQIAAIEKKYDREISLAEGNAYLTKKLEKQKESEIAKEKEEASKKSFAMQVIAAVAQTATNALNAYGSAAAIPIVGHILAPIAAATAVAAGAVQIATLKKQQQAAAATGYSEGGFTRPGRVDEPAGVVHAGEWVASQKLVNSPQTRPLINMLEYAQRNNTMASLSMEDVSRSIAAPMMLAYSKPEQQAPVIIQQTTPDSSGATVAALNDSISRLNARLDEPFVTHNTVAGDMGIKQAQDKYQKIMSNKSRKKRS